MKIVDISRPLTNDLAPWPGDTAFRFGLSWKMAEGASVNVGAINMSLHNGTHADAPFHFEQNGFSIDRMPLDHYVGPAVVVDLTKRFEKAADQTGNGEIQIADLAPCSDSLRRAQRLLLKTNVWMNSTVFPGWIPVVARGVPEWLRDHQVKLLGLDLPSVDPIDAKKLTNHYALNQAGIAILESLDLTQVREGIYHLAALPLKVAGGDAGPVRAILWQD